MEMKLLGGTLPDKITMDGISYPIYTDFQNWIRLESLLFEEEGSFLSKLPTLLALCYKKLPPDLESAVDGMVSFYAGPAKTGKSGVRTRPSYSFVQDEALIYGAFYQQYGIDLLSKKLHWWQFRALLQSLTDKTLFARVIQYRLINISSIKTPENRRFYRQMKDLYKLEDTRTEAAKDADIYDALVGLF